MGTESVGIKTAVAAVGAAAMLQRYIKYRDSTKESIERAMNDKQLNCPSEISPKVAAATASPSYSDLLLSMQTLFSDLDQSYFDTVPMLLSRPSLDICADVRSNAENLYDVQFTPVQNKAVADLSALRTSYLSEVDTSFRARIADVPFADDRRDLQLKLQALETMLGDYLLTTMDAVKQKVVDSRFSQLKQLFDQILNGKLLVYNKFIMAFKRIDATMSPTNQLEIWIQDSVQSTYKTLLDSTVTKDQFDKFVSNRDALMKFLNDEVSAPTLETDCWTGMQDVISSQSAQALFSNQIIRSYSTLFDDTRSSAAYSDTQKSLLYARLKSVRDSSVAVATGTIDAVEAKSQMATYAAQLRSSVVVCIFALYLEYETLRVRVVTEAEQTVILRFFELKQAINYTFLFYFAQDQDMTLNAVVPAFWKYWNSTMDGASGSILGTVDAAMLSYRYDDAREYVQETIDMLLSEDVDIRRFVTDSLEAFHTVFGAYVSALIPDTVSATVQRDRPALEAVITNTVNGFAGDIAFTTAAYQLNCIRDAVMVDAYDKYQSTLADVLVLGKQYQSDCLVPYTAQWFEDVKDRFVTNSKIDFDAMRKYVANQLSASTKSALVASKSVAKDLATKRITDTYTLITKYNTSQGAMVAGLDPAWVSADRKVILQQLSDGMVIGMTAFTKTVESNMSVKCDQVFLINDQAVYDTGDIITTSFFETVAFEVQNQFVVRVTDGFTEIYKTYYDLIDVQTQEIATAADNTYTGLTAEVTAFEKKSRDGSVAAIDAAIKVKTDFIVTEYTIVSFKANQTQIEASIRAAALAATTASAAERVTFYTDLNARYRQAKSAQIMDISLRTDKLNSDFRSVLVQKFLALQILGQDILQYVLPLIQAAQNAIFPALVERYTLESAYAMSNPVLVLPDDLAPSDLPDYDTWLRSKIDSAIVTAETAMNKELISNTCPTKPPCGPGYTQKLNSYKVDCCFFEPDPKKFTKWEITGMIAKTVLIAIGVNVAFDKISHMVGKQMLKYGKSYGKVGGEYAVKIMAKVTTKLIARSPKLAAIGVKMSARVVEAKAMKLAAKKFASSVAEKIALKLGMKVASKAGVALAKSLTKAMSFGPVGAAMLVFDLLSMALDLWDPAGYNDAQTAGPIAEMRDQIVSKYETMYESNGFTLPLAAPVLYNVKESKQLAAIQNMTTEWVTTTYADYIENNQATLDAMSNSQAALATQKALSDTLNRPDVEPDLSANIMVSNVKNTFALRNPKTQLLACVLNREGTRLHNEFGVAKGSFINGANAKLFKVLGKVKGRTGEDMVPLYTNVKITQNQMERLAPALALFYTAEKLFWMTYENSSLDQIKTCTFADVSASVNVVVAAYEKYSAGVKDANDQKVLTTMLLWLPYYQADANDRIAQLTAEERNATHKSRSTVINYDSPVFESLAKPLLTQLEAQARYLISCADQATDDNVVAQAMIDLLPTYQKNGAERVAALTKEQLLVTASDSDIDYTASYFKNMNPSLLALLEDEVRANIQKAFDKKVLTEMTVLRYSFKASSATRLAALTPAMRNAKYESASDVIDYGGSLFTGMEPAIVAQLEEQARFLVTDQADEDDEDEGDYDPVEPDFAVFKDGYGQLSPLYTISTQCASMGYGVTFNEDLGLCDFSKDYCKRYGTDYFFNKKLGVGDCRVGIAQKGAELILGTTVTRTFKRLGATADDDYQVDNYTPVYISIMSYNAGWTSYESPQSVLANLQAQGVDVPENLVYACNNPGLFLNMKREEIDAKSREAWNLGGKLSKFMAA